MRSRCHAAALALALAVACSFACSRARRHEDVGWTRAEWLAAVDGFVADPSTLPSLHGDIRSRALFDKIVSNHAWRALDRSTIATEDELLRFFPVLKRLEVAVAHERHADEIVAVQLFALDVYRAFVLAGLDFVDDLPEDDPTRENRGRGLQEIRVEAAIEICSMLNTALFASGDVRATVVAKLGEPHSYDFLSRSPLQLILATLDEQLLPAAGKDLRPAYKQLRDTVARLHELAPAQPGVRTTYEGLILTPHPLVATRYQSHTGHFSVELPATALVKRIELDQPGSTTQVQHWITSQDGETSYEATCFDGKTAAELAEKLRNQPDVLRGESKVPGELYVKFSDTREEEIRTIDIGGRGCLLDAAAPKGHLDTDRADAFLLSIQPG